MQLQIHLHAGQNPRPDASETAAASPLPAAAASAAPAVPTDGVLAAPADVHAVAALCTAACRQPRRACRRWRLRRRRVRHPPQSTGPVFPCTVDFGAQAQGQERAADWQGSSAESGRPSLLSPASSRMVRRVRPRQPALRRGPKDARMQVRVARDPQLRSLRACHVGLSPSLRQCLRGKLSIFLKFWETFPNFGIRV